MPRRKPVAAAAAADLYVRCTPGTACAPVAASDDVDARLDAFIAEKTPRRSGSPLQRAQEKRPSASDIQRTLDKNGAGFSLNEPPKRKRGRPPKDQREKAADALNKLMAGAEPVEKPKRGGPLPSKRVFLFSDVHFCEHEPVVWDAFKQACEYFRPDVIIGDGDLIDAGQVSRHEKSAYDPVFLIDEIEMLVREVKLLLQWTSRVILVPGNHDLRINRYLSGANPQALRGLKGLTFQEICKAHGMPPEVEWYVESVRTQRLEIGGCIVRHGHVGEGRFGGGKFPARIELMKAMGHDTVKGHTHKLGYVTVTAFGETSYSVSNACMARPAEYSGMNADWQHSFTALELMAPDFTVATPAPVLIRDGAFSYSGMTFRGRAP